jgi:Protein of unknown function (DUF1153)
VGQGIVLIPPVPATGHYTRKRKAAILACIASGGLSEVQALSRYDLTVEELQEWREALREHGLDGLAARFRDRIRRREKVVIGYHRAYRWLRLPNGGLVRVPEPDYRRAMLRKAA